MTKRPNVGTRLGLVLLAALLALPIVPTASPVMAKTRLRTVTRPFRNTAPIELPVTQTAPASATLYPSRQAARLHPVDVLRYE